jgi:hypothetical protein
MMLGFFVVQSAVMRLSGIRLNAAWALACISFIALSLLAF